MSSFCIRRPIQIRKDGILHAPNSSADLMNLVYPNSLLPMVKKCEVVPVLK
jgi:hypothetical protein